MAHDSDGDPGRIDAVERHLEAVMSRLDRLEEQLAGTSTPVATHPVVPAPPSAPTATGVAPSPVARARERVDLEELFGGRMLAWLGATAIVLGAGFFVAVAVSRGWIDEPTRIAIATCASLGLLGVGVWLRERRGAPQASLAAVGAALASLYLTLTAATQLYDLVPTALALSLALVIGVLAGVIAIRWDARLIAGIGIVGAISAPVLVGAETSFGTAAFLLVALGAAVAVLVWRRWNWLGVSAFLVSAPQLLDFAADVGPGPERWGALAATGTFWIMLTIAALGYELRHRESSMRPSSGVLISGGALTAAIGGWVALAEGGDNTLGDLWVALLAIAAIAVSEAALRSSASRAVAQWHLGVGAALGAIALSLLLDGPVLVVADAVSAVAFGTAAKLRRDLVAAGCAGTFGALAIAHVLTVEAPLSALTDGADDMAGAGIALGTLALALAVAARMLRRADARLSNSLAAGCGGTLVYLASVTIVTLFGTGSGISASLDADQRAQLLLSAFWALTGFGLLLVGLTRGARAVRLGGFSLLGLAIAKVFVYDLSALDSVYRVLALVAIGLLSLLAALAWQRMGGGPGARSRSSTSEAPAQGPAVGNQAP